MREENTLWTPTEDFRTNAEVISLHTATVGDIRPTLLILLGTVGLLLLVTCANVANLLLARGLYRSRDVALRGALGASRFRLAREQIVESAVIAGLGCLVAFVLATWSLDGLVALLPSEIPRAHEITLDLRVVGAGVVIALLAAMLAGVVPALRGSRTDPGLALRAGSRGAGASSVGRRRLSLWMVIGQVAIAVVLVIQSGLLLRSLAALSRVETGFDPIGVTTARVTLAGATYDEPALRNRFFEIVAERLSTVPGVTAVAVGSRVPFGAGWSGIATFIDGVTEDPNDLPVLGRVQAAPDYLKTLGIPLLAGRGLESSDRSDTRLVAVVDETAAKEFWPNESPIGRRIRYPWRGAPWIEVVGVVGGVVDSDLTADRTPTFYVPISQAPPGAGTLVVRSDYARGEVVVAIRNIIPEIDASVPVSRVSSLQALVSGSMARTRWTANLLTLFALTTLLLGCVGVYGVVAYSVRARTGEIGVRIALGAGRHRIRRSILTEAALLAVPGTAIGMVVAMPGARVMKGLLYGVSTWDPAVFVTAGIVLPAAAILAAYIPARRATNIDPVVALKI